MEPQREWASRREVQAGVHGSPLLTPPLLMVVVPFVVVPVVFVDVSTPLVGGGCGHRVDSVVVSGLHQ
jgi:hypothetical protein